MDADVDRHLPSPIVLSELPQKKVCVFHDHLYSNIKDIPILPTIVNHDKKTYSRRPKRNGNETAISEMKKPETEKSPSSEPSVVCSAVQQIGPKCAVKRKGLQLKKVPQSQPTLSSTQGVTVQIVLKSTTAPSSANNSTSKNVLQSTIIQSSVSEVTSKNVLQNVLQPTTAVIDPTKILPCPLSWVTSKDDVESVLEEQRSTTWRMSKEATSRPSPQYARQSTIVPHSSVNNPQPMFISRFPLGITSTNVLQPVTAPNVPRMILMNSPQSHILPLGIPFGINGLPRLDSNAIPRLIPMFSTQPNIIFAQDENVQCRNLMVATNGIATSRLIPLQSPGMNPPMQMFLPTPLENGNFSELSNGINALQGGNWMATPEFVRPTGEIYSNEMLMTRQWDVQAKIFREIEIIKALQREKIKLVNELSKKECAVNLTVQTSTVRHQPFCTKMRPEEKKFDNVQLTGTPQIGAQNSVVPEEPIQCDNVIMCEKCGEIFNNLLQKQQHVENRHHFAGWYCFPCNKNFEDLLKFWSHGCNNKLKNSFTFNYMYDVKFTCGKLIKRPFYGKDEIWQCKLCYQLYFSENVLRNHIVNCIVKCEICHIVFTCAEHYPKHVIHCRLRMKKKRTRISDVIRCKHCGTLVDKDVKVFQEHVKFCLVMTERKLFFCKSEYMTKTWFNKLRDGRVNDGRMSVIPTPQPPLSEYCGVASSEVKPDVDSSKNIRKLPKLVKIDYQLLFARESRSLSVVEKLPVGVQQKICQNDVMVTGENWIDEKEKSEVTVENAGFGVGNGSVDKCNTSTDLGVNNQIDTESRSSPSFNFVITDVRGAVDFFSENDKDLLSSTSAIEEPSQKETNSLPCLQNIKLEVLDVDVEPRNEKRRTKICSRCGHKFPTGSYDDHPCDKFYSRLTSCRVELYDVFKVRRGRSLKITNFDEIFSRHFTNILLKSQCSTERGEKKLSVDFNETETDQSVSRNSAKRAKKRIREFLLLENVSSEAEEEEKSQKTKPGAKRIKVEVKVEPKSDCQIILQQDPDVNDPEWKYKCLACDKKFFIYKVYLIHMRTHTEHLPYFCEDCGCGFMKKCGYTNHRKFARKSEKFKCYDCGHEFCTRSQLVAHADLHKFEKYL